MKKLYFLFFLIIGFLGNAQIVNIPDANFKAVLLGSSQYNYIAKDLSGNYFAIDSNNDSEIQISEALNVSYLEINSFNISYLQGIEFFTNLQVLNCSYNYLSELIIDDLINLRDLNCSNNQITSLDLSNNLLLQMLNCGLNQISFLNINNLSNLEQLICTGNQISDLNLSWLINLQYLYCTSNQLTNLDLTNLINLQALYCSSNQITQLNLEDSNNLIELICEYNELISLNVKNGNVNNWYNLFFDGNPNLQYICTDESDVSFIQSKINTYGYTNCHVNSYCSFTPGGTFYEISGNTKFDLNNNGCDVSDINYSNLRFNITNGTVTGSTISNQTGNYYIPVQAGNHTITPNLENPSYFNISPTSFTVNFPTQTSPFMQDFCVTANGVKSDLEVVLLPTTPARPGFDATYKLFYRNKGNQVENGTVSLTFDDASLDYVAANPIYNSSATNSFTWNYSNLQPFETREIGIVFNVNSPMETPAVNNGDILNYTATITTANTDETPLDNTFILDQTVVGSYDPNDKTCLEGTTIAPTEVGKYVHYVIRFENTGTYPAENIVVKDMIDLAKFDIATLVPLKSSHDFFTRISGNKVEFIFENINLDFNDATNDGYVVFKIKTLPSLVLGDTFTNNANIYFDYNFPITTNTYTTTVAALSTQDFDFGTYFTLYPNPAKDVLNIQTKQDLEVNSIEIYNQLGQIVMAVTNAVNSVDVANLASGTYFVKVNTEKGSANTKFVKE